MNTLAKAAVSLGILFFLSNLAYSQPCTDPGSIVSVTNTSSGIFEYVTFKIKRPVNSDYGYSVATVFAPFKEQPSDNPVTITGPHYKRIRFRGITWMCEIGENFVLPKSTIKDIKRLEQHEGIVVYVVGYKKTAIKRYVSTTTSSTSSHRLVKMKFRK
jgi:hypothetical protein